MNKNEVVDILTECAEYFDNIADHDDVERKLIMKINSLLKELNKKESEWNTVP